MMIAAPPTHSADEIAVQVQGLQRRYGNRIVIADLGLSIAAGEFVALLGESGCGKTTLLRVLAELDTPDAGTLTSNGTSAVVFQEHRLLPWADVLSNVMLGLDASAEPLARNALAEVGLAGREHDWPRNLSGGQAQRVALARALVRRPRLMLLDEPFAALDALTRIKMHVLVKELITRHRPGALIVTHDVDEAIAIADRILVMKAGRIAAEYTKVQKADFTTLRHHLLGDLGVTDDLDHHSSL